MLTRIVYAAWLGQMEFKDEARKYWKVASMERPDDSRLRSLAAARAGKAAWRRWGPFVSERQWGTVREDYSAGGTPWEYLPHDHARSRAYRWGEHGIAGICDDRQRLCFAVALWNGADPILKERMFRLAGHEKDAYWLHSDAPDVTLFAEHGPTPDPALLPTPAFEFDPRLTW